MENLHFLLQEQIKDSLEGFGHSPEMKELLEKVSQTYQQLEQDKRSADAEFTIKSAENAHIEEQLNKTNKELDRFVYSISHDLRAPMTTLLGLLNIAEQEQNMGALRQYQVLMRNSLKRMDHFISNLLNYSSSNRLENSPEPIYLKELTEEIASNLRHLPNAFSIDFITDFETETPFYSDLHKVKIVLSNLLSNAILFHNLNQERPYIRLQARGNSSTFSLTIEDNGQGIEEEFHEKIFGMFFRGNKSSTGNGLGLYIVKETVEKLNGQLSFRSTPGHGTTFLIELPNMQAAREKAVTEELHQK